METRKAYEGAIGHLEAVTLTDLTHRKKLCNEVRAHVEALEKLAYDNRIECDDDADSNEKAATRTRELRIYLTTPTTAKLQCQPEDNAWFEDFCSRFSNTDLDSAVLLRLHEGHVLQVGSSFGFARATLLPPESNANASYRPGDVALVNPKCNAYDPNEREATFTCDRLAIVDESGWPDVRPLPAPQPVPPAPQPVPPAPHSILCSLPCSSCGGRGFEWAGSAGGGDLTLPCSRCGGSKVEPSARCKGPHGSHRFDTVEDAAGRRHCSDCDMLVGKDGAAVPLTLNQRMRREIDEEVLGPSERARIGGPSLLEEKHARGLAEVAAEQQIERLLANQLADGKEIARLKEMLGSYERDAQKSTREIATLRERLASWDASFKKAPPVGSNDACLWCGKSPEDGSKYCSSQCRERHEAQQAKTRDPRTNRQAVAYAWVERTFGHAASLPKERACRFIEEAVELAQAVGLDAHEVEKIVGHVFDKPRGDTSQEVGGVGVTLLALCESLRIDANHEEDRELARVLAIDPEHFRKRHNVKADAGIAVRVTCDDSNNTPADVEAGKLNVDVNVDVSDQTTVHLPTEPSDTTWTVEVKNVVVIDRPRQNELPDACPLCSDKLPHIHTKEDADALTKRKAAIERATKLEAAAKELLATFDLVTGGDSDYLRGSTVAKALIPKIDSIRLALGGE